eukprot:11148512-Alexandrium_andersonii.AAC.1
MGRLNYRSRVPWGSTCHSWGAEDYVRVSGRTHTHLGSLHVKVRPQRARQALAAHAEPHSPDDGHGDHRNDHSNNDGEAITAGGVRVR